MPNVRPHPPSNYFADRGPDPAAERDNHALDRRHHLDAQQRAIRDSVPPPHFARRRPPG
jgi:hypothetical protein